jgi:hypothetical protein
VVIQKKGFFLLLLFEKIFIPLCVDFKRVLFMEALQQKRKLDRETQNKVGFMAFIINKFATTYKMNRQEAYLYLKKYGGLDFLNECWWALHTDNSMWAVRDMYLVCYNNGGLK